jgi:G3E family GTPase
MMAREMIAVTENRIRLTVLGGFLGSGKTTWLRHQLRFGSMSDAWVIVNEAADIPVDDALLDGFARSSVLAGACACCDGRQALIETLRGICDRRVGSDDTIDHVVLETSGLADPGPIIEAIRIDPVLVHHIVVGEIMVAVDALHGLAQLKSEPLGRRQVEAADSLIVTKVDKAEESAMKRLLAMLHLLNPGAGVSGAIMGSEAALPDATGTTAETFSDLSAAEVVPILAARLDLDPSIDWTAFSVWLSALLHARGEDVMRVKGVVRTPAGRLLLQSVRKVVQSPEILPESKASGRGEDNSVVFIGRGFSAKDLRQSLHYFAGAASF